MKNILFQNRAEETWMGGDFFQLKKTMEAISNLGYHCEFSSDTNADKLLNDFEIVHTFNFSMQWTEKQINRAYAKGKKIVSSMIYHERGDFVSYDSQQRMVNMTDAMIFQTEGELDRAKRHLNIPDEKIFIIPNGIESWWFDPINTIKKDIVLTVGRIGPFKNQALVAKACNMINIPCICVGEIESKRYADEILSYGGIIIPPMNHKDLKSLYAICKVFVMASQNETWSLVVDEAGSQGANIVLTSGCERENIPNVERCDPKDVMSVRFAIQRALKLSPNEEFREVLKINTWRSVGEKIIKIYETFT